MSFKSDKWIKEQCTGPRFEIYRYHPGRSVMDSPKELVHTNLGLDDPRVREYKEPLMSLALNHTFVISNDLAFKKISNGDMITPFVGHSEKVIVRNDKLVNAPSYGLSSYGYDIRLGRNFKVMHGSRTSTNAIIDPTEPENMEGFFKDFTDVDALEIRPHSFVLGVSMEQFKIPKDVTVICMPKSSLARCGLVAFITPAEAGWSGFLTIEMKNETDHPIRVHAGMGIMQLLFSQGEPCEVSYSDRNGKYQHQPALPVVAR